VAKGEPLSSTRLPFALILNPETKFGTALLLTYKNLPFVMIIGVSSSLPHPPNNKPATATSARKKCLHILMIIPPLFGFTATDHIDIELQCLH
jgi:hypothetical protein